MSQALTVGMVVYPLLVLLAVGVAVTVLAFVLSIFADAFKH